MKKFFRISLALVVALVMSLSASAGKYEYRTVPGDDMNALLYTLPNGLKVYMSVNKEKPRIQTYVAVRVGGKNDPAETTGLAHYFEHLMFKGTKRFGTKDYAAEEPMLNEIEQLFETYRHTTDEAARKALYHRIDSVSYEASKLAIPNEYDKLMSAIGANGTNAYTSTDVTCYTEDIPSNQIENWARIQADRFANPVIRGFHTELETIYEEKNMSLTRDARKCQETILQLLFPNHPYGTQTVIGTQENLKNPSITNVKNYHKQWYVPNNMAICLSGDFEPDAMMDVIVKYFGALKPNPNLPKLEFTPEKPILSPKSAIVMGKDAEMLYLAWRFPGAASREVEVLNVLTSLLSNGKVGLLDVDINQQQKMLSAGCGIYDMADYSALLLVGRPKAGQTLGDVRQLLLDEIQKLREGKFDESLIESTINNYRMSQQRLLESNSGRADQFVQAFVNGKDWADECSSLDRQSKLTKADIVEFANKYLLSSNYAVVYKMKGEDPGELKMPKAELTPLEMNRDSQSAFLAEIANSKVAPIEPVFVDFSKDMSISKTKAGQSLLYKHNDVNQIATVQFVYDMGSAASRTFDEARGYLNYLGTKDMSAEQIKAELYRLACSYSISASTNRTRVSITGLSENLPKAISIVEKLIANAQVDTTAWNNLVARSEKAMADAKLNQSANFSKLASYVTYGGVDNPSNYTSLTPAELRKVNPADLVAEIKKLMSYKHEITYYGPLSQKEAAAMLAKVHQPAKKLVACPATRKFAKVQPKETTFYIAPYEAKQLYMMLLSNRGEKFDINFETPRSMYCEYFSGGMNSIVFQEMRERRSLAYSAYATMSGVSTLEDPYIVTGQIATQNDKMLTAIGAFDEILNVFPASEPVFKRAIDGLLTRLRTNRVTGTSVFNKYFTHKDLGLTEDSNKRFYNEVQSLTLDDVMKFQQKNIKGRIYNYGILGDIKDLDLEGLKKLGTVKTLTTEEIFGY